ncbi:esterase-like activity of phytase family protein [uncultured Tateyamaria sp.]|uniref:esterase-like activity of phytase family protein n=1 Tax=uncultured Tateyamaria sp. TaxID=455651 RepID=UPI002631CADD|nr:esterase-like activity of phytase family protein [uncultured Tateyamaria sp.]
MLWRSGLALILTAVAAVAEPLSFVGQHPLASDLPGFGGLSAIEMRSGTSALVLSDRGMSFALTLDRDAQRVTAEPVPVAWENRDSEGLAWASNRLYVSYEGPAEVSTASGRALPRAPNYWIFPGNRGFEALAGAPDGTLYAIPERGPARSDPIPVFRYLAGRWTTLTHLPPPKGFLPVGADIGPDGELYLLLRSFSPLGFRSRIIRLDPEDPESERTVLLTTRPGQFDNLEGLAIWQSDSGATCLTMVSDDNFRSLQRTELVEYALTETLEGGATCN